MITVGYSHLLSFWGIDTNVNSDLGRIWLGARDINESKNHDETYEKIWALHMMPLGCYV